MVYSSFYDFVSPCLTRKVKSKEGENAALLLKEGKQIENKWLILETTETKSGDTNNTKNSVRAPVEPT